MKREDFEIYEFNRGKQHYWAFKVDYIGYYIAQSEKEILRLRDKARITVKNKLEWVEEENQRYYARLAEEERKRALSFKEARKAHRASENKKVLITHNLTEQQQKDVDERIYRMIKAGKDNDSIQAATCAPYSHINKIRFEIQEG